MNNNFQAFSLSEVFLFVVEMHRLLKLSSKYQGFRRNEFKSESGSDGDSCSDDINIEIKLST